jgi:hypothetical protein
LHAAAAFDSVNRWAMPLANRFRKILKQAACLATEMSMGLVAPLLMLAANT